MSADETSEVLAGLARHRVELEGLLQRAVALTTELDRIETELQAVGKRLADVDGAKVKAAKSSGQFAIVSCDHSLGF